MPVGPVTELELDVGYGADDDPEIITPLEMPELRGPAVDEAYTVPVPVPVGPMSEVELDVG